MIVYSARGFATVRKSELLSQLMLRLYLYGEQQYRAASTRDAAATSDDQRDYHEDLIYKTLIHC
ncbi:uncharacterized protein PHALS_14882 [Plasmopara halstedii]|uniref:Uncharacterized protein n=1 Tax=Plasmopara halstedii TaxID=4781 RepID=A0A0P1AX15_PLAHL|nr:uncharacterized protein PHALS_14882 [Plasmopara halstedii]CEG46172.1 hypothetical protein PHALS_14882 [Plasmopara halstedii]|eukprot:XP_024582541.1 hypothetical protein PHALS_14882 [Plasmopara halstedii]